MINTNQNFNVLNDFDPNQYNLLIPVLSIQEINPIYKIVVNTVFISTNLQDAEIYKESGAAKINGQDMFALTHRALLKLSTAANGQIVESRKVKPKACEKCIEIVQATKIAPVCGTCPCSANVAFLAIMRFPELSGGWRIVQATKEYDFSQIKGKDGQIVKMKEFSSEHVESKALSRCIRKGLSVKNAYTLQELQKPFVVAYPTLDSRDPDVKKALIAGSVAASNLLYGSNLQLTAPKQEALPSGVDMSTGEVIDIDYDCEQIQYQEEQSQQVQQYLCNNPQCKTEIAQNIAEASIQQFNQPLCYKCQQIMRGANNK